jgi:TonB family protein
MKPIERKPLRISIFFVLLTVIFAAYNVNAQKTRELTQDGDDDQKPQKRTALVIGNANYTTARKLENSSNDATDMANSLSAVGFDVVSGTNLTLKQMNDKVREFGDKLKANGGVGLFYYAGHGIQVSGKNYLIPVDAAIPREDEVDFNALNLDLVLRKMGSANNGLNIVILDACRNNPFARSWSRGDDEGGLAQIAAPTGTFIAYSTSPDKTASDGAGRNGLYTAELLKVMKQPNLKIEETFKEVRKAVSKTSGGKQIPWDSSSLSGDFYFTQGGQNTSVKTPVVKTPVVNNPSKPDVKPAPNSKLVNVGIINSRAISLTKPKYPAEAKAANASGEVRVQVVIDKEGNVTSANAVSGDPLLRESAVNAALTSKFNPILVNGKAVEVTGALVYNFINK